MVQDAPLNAAERYKKGVGPAGGDGGSIKGINDSNDIDDGDLDPDQIEARQREIATKLGTDLCVFLLFLISFTITVILAHSSESAQFVDKIDYFIEAKNSTVPLKKVESIESFYNYFEYSLVDLVGRNATEREYAEELSHTLIPLDGSNRLFGAIQVRQLRSAVETDCMVGSMFKKYKTDCYPSFTTKTMDKTAYGPDSKYKYEGRDDKPSVTGKIADYPAGGYFMPLTNNATELTTNIRLYRAGKYVDLGTRAIFVDFTVYNVNINQYGVTRVLFEFSPGGSVYVTKKIAVLTPNLLTFFAATTTSDQIRNILELVVVIFVLYYIAEELSEISIERWDYFGDGWNILDWFNMALLLIAFTMRMAAYMDISALSPALNKAELAEQTASTAYTDITPVASKVENARMFNSFNAILLWGKCIKYIGYFPYISFLFHTVKRAMGSFWSFAVLYFITFFAFTTCFLVAFGDILVDLSSLDKAVVFLARSFIADVDVLPIYKLSPFFGGVLIICFYIQVVVIGINIFFSIMAATLVEESYNPGTGDDDDEGKEEAIVVVWAMFKNKIASIFKLEKRLKQLAPALHKRFYGKKKEESVEEKYEVGKDSPSSAGTKRKRGESGKKGENMTLDEDIPRSHKSIKDFSPKEIMCSVENMAGRILSKVHAVGIEIRIEMLRVQESLNQMITVSTTLSNRIVKISKAQKSLLEDLIET